MRLFSSSTLNELQLNIQADGPKAANWQRLLARVDTWCADKVALPNESGGWIHNYICPTHWLPLIYDGNKPTEHLCPAGDVSQGDAYDEAWRAWRHREIADMTREVALAYVVTKQANYLLEVERVLQHYSAFYANFVGADSAESWMITARVFNQALTEALWAIPLIHAFDLVSADLATPSRLKIEATFLHPLAETMAHAQDALIAKDNVKSNYMAWFNAALGCLGYTLKDSTLVHRATDGTGGFFNHLEVGVLADGMQYEVTPYYHNFVVLAYQILAEAAAANGSNLYAIECAEGQSISAMCAALTELMLPDGTIADLGDGSYWIDSVYDRELIEVYEMAAARDSSNFSSQKMLAHAYERSQRERDGWAALIFGLAELKSASAAPSKKQRVLPEAGVAITTSSPHLSAVTPFGAYRDSHSHADQLSLQIWPFSSDAGCVLYGIPARRDWYQSAYAHNTLVVNGSAPKQFSQGNFSTQTTNDKHCLELESVDAFAADVKRSLWVGPNGIEDTLTVSAENTQTYDWVFHVDGDLSLDNHASKEANYPLGDSVAAQQILVTSTINEIELAEFSITYQGINYSLKLTGSEPFELLLGSAPGKSWDPTKRRHVIIGRTKGKLQRYQMTITHD